MAQTASDVLVDTLINWGVDTIFGIPGDGINGIIEALRTRKDEIRFIQTRHEESAAFMACGYAKYTGRLGVCIATSGPGGIHLLNGLYDAKLDGQSVLAITGLQFSDLVSTHTQQDVELDKLFIDVATAYNSTAPSRPGAASCGPIYDGLRLSVGTTPERELDGIIAGGGRKGEIYGQLRGLRDRHADEIRRRFPDIPRRVSGYSLNQLLPENGFHVARALVGSEGTCVTILGATVRLEPEPTHRALMAIGFEDIACAADYVPRLLEYGPIGVEGIDERLVRNLREKHLHTRDVELLPIMYGPEIVEAFRAFKAVWDPRGRMNPGRVVDPVPLDALLRMGPRFRPPDLDTHFAYPDDKRSFARAAMRCVGVGKCRRAAAYGGTMCPSFKATRDEQHSTRGRAHLLQEMLQGDPVRDAWKSEAVHAALDLCLSCKGCKSDCPVNVDMAAYKAEFLSHHYEGRLRPRAAYSIGLVHRWARLFAPVSRFARHTFRSRFRPSPGKEGRAPIILWADSFNDHFAPDVLHAAAAVLAATGHPVAMLSPPYASNSGPI